MTDTDRLARLPKWAQDEISHLRRELRATERQLSEHLERGDFVPGDFNAVRVPTNTRLHAAPSPVTWGALSVTFKDGDEIEVSGSGGLTVDPTANNVLTVTHRDRDGR